VIALQILHQMDVSPDLEVAGALALYFAELAPAASIDGSGGDHEGDQDVDGGQGAEAEAGAVKTDRPLIEELVLGVSRQRQELDAILTGLSKNWRVERMAVVDRNVIRLALYELKYCPDVPVNVVLNEAIELAKQFGSSEAGAFVNGLLDRAVDELGLRK
jgi:N utilization substance protein B